MPKLGLIAGNRQFPIHVARAARALGYEVVAVALREETEAALERAVDRMHWVTLGEVGRIPEIFRAEGVRALILAGQIKPQRLLAGESRFEGVARALVQRLPDRSGHSAMKRAVRFLKAQGFRVLASDHFLKAWIPAARRVLTARVPTAAERADLSHGLKLARRLAAYGIGQTVVVRHKAVVALEAMEGTDAAIRRSGQIAGPGCVVVKAAGPRQDMRFDIPVIGDSTLAAMTEAGAACLGVERGRTLLLERERLIAQADERKLTLVVL